MKIMIEKVLQDIAERGSSLGAVILVDDQNQLQFVSYNSNGTVSFVSDKVNCIGLYNKPDGPETRRIQPIVDLCILNNKT